MASAAAGGGLLQRLVLLRVSSAGALLDERTTLPPLAPTATVSELLATAASPSLRVFHGGAAVNDNATLASLGLADGAFIVAASVDDAVDDEDDDRAEAGLRPAASGPPPGLALRRALRLARRGFLRGLAPHLAGDGLGGTYFLEDPERGAPAYVACFKPLDEEIETPHNPRGHCGAGLGLPLAARAGLYSGEQYAREVAAFVLDACGGGLHSVPPTCVAEAWHPAFAQGNDAQTRKTGSLQTFLEGVESAEDHGASHFSDFEVQKIALLDLRILNSDRNEANMMVLAEQVSQAALDELGALMVAAAAPGTSTHALHLVRRLLPIDHGLSMPDSVNVAFSELAWLSWPQVRRPLHPRLRDAFFRVDIDATLAVLSAFMGERLRPENYSLLRVAHSVLRTGLEAGLTLADVGALIARMDSGASKPSKLEHMLALARTQARQQMQQRTLLELPVPPRQPLLPLLPQGPAAPPPPAVVAMLAVAASMTAARHASAVRGRARARVRQLVSASPSALLAALGVSADAAAHLAASGLVISLSLSISADALHAAPTALCAARADVEAEVPSPDGAAETIISARGLLRDVVGDHAPLFDPAAPVSPLPAVFDLGPADVVTAVAVSAAWLHAGSVSFAVAAATPFLQGVVLVGAEELLSACTVAAAAAVASAAINLVSHGGNCASALAPLARELLPAVPAPIALSAARGRPRLQRVGALPAPTAAAAEAPISVPSSVPAPLSARRELSIIASPYGSTLGRSTSLDALAAASTAATAAAAAAAAAPAPPISDLRRHILNRQALLRGVATEIEEDSLPPPRLCVVVLARTGAGARASLASRMVAARAAGSRAGDLLLVAARSGEGVDTVESSDSSHGSGSGSGSGSEGGPREVDESGPGHDDGFQPSPATVDPGASPSPSFASFSLFAGPGALGGAFDSSPLAVSTPLPTNDFVADDSTDTSSAGDVGAGPDPVTLVSRALRILGVASLVRARAARVRAAPSAMRPPPPSSLLRVGSVLQRATQRKPRTPAQPALARLRFPRASTYSTDLSLGEPQPQPLSSSSESATDEESLTFAGLQRWLSAVVDVTAARKSARQ